MNLPCLPASGRLAVYDTPRGPFDVRSYPLRPPRPGEVLVKVRMSTICRSDIHSWLGHRPNPCPGVLGHEIIGDIVALGEGMRADMRGDPLRPGDRVTWSEFFVPGPDYHSEVLGMPQKSVGVDKYGHMAVQTDPHHHGGFGEYCYILPRSWILRLPEVLSDEEATPINCGVATVVCITEQAGIGLGDTVVVQGLGLLGLYTAAVARARGARRVVGIDRVAARRRMAPGFGVDVAIDPRGLAGRDLADAVRAACGGPGADVVVEVCGDARVVNDGIGFLREGGRYVLGGVVSPGAFVRVDANLILRKLLTVRGVHNYHPRHLLGALEFVVAHRERFAFGALVDARYPLSRVGEAMDDAARRRVLRAAIVPGMDDREMTACA